MKRQHIVYNYGEDEDECGGEELLAELKLQIRDGTVPHHIPALFEKPDNIDVVLGGKKCKCGSTTHQRISHCECPLNKKKQQ